MHLLRRQALPFYFIGKLKVLDFTTIFNSPVYLNIHIKIKER